MTSNCWNKNAETGIEKFDSHYHMICDILDYLFISLNSDSSQEGCDILTALYDYISHYCSDEELMMLENGFPDFVKHKLAHDEFLRNIDLQLKMIQVNEASVAGTAQFIKTWLNLHIICEDAKHVEHVKKQKLNSSAR